jgi:hypothetical protein
LNHFDDIKDRITYIDCEKFKGIESIKNVDLFIADSSLAECNREVQSEYVDKVLMNSKFGYIVYNTLHLDNSRSDYDYLYNKLSDSFNIRTLEHSVTFMFLGKK